MRDDDLKTKDGLYDISKIGLDRRTPTKPKPQNNYNPFDYEVKYKELLNVLSEHQKEITELKLMNKQLRANFDLLAEAVNGKSKT